ncbi:uncharacterized protein K489DRAFT_178118 [Dissoconium aciculare CBS 342.82]|uniref:Uncharacterized protein n=1 Tax=Dissoconium aciculare CBS 342.82 TaxID=1314786 RepID=A0A6J3M8Q4_9PEZI|nr:uncharacterized protein K489DRAFT_178118 [Dissoconium aciculare CBS 342.82]KAF1824253.1 hypothetical protein K489DRAFT_178118 [Dissoconium aciculare CBS 342.82]
MERGRKIPPLLHMRCPKTGLRLAMDSIHFDRFPFWLAAFQPNISQSVESHTSTASLVYSTPFGALEARCDRQWSLLSHAVPFIIAISALGCHKTIHLSSSLASRLRFLSFCVTTSSGRLAIITSSTTTCLVVLPVLQGLSTAVSDSITSVECDCEYLLAELGCVSNLSTSSLLESTFPET